MILDQNSSGSRPDRRTKRPAIAGFFFTTEAKPCRAQQNIEGAGTKQQKKTRDSGPLFEYLQVLESLKISPLIIIGCGESIAKIHLDKSFRSFGSLVKHFFCG